MATSIARKPAAAQQRPASGVPVAAPDNPTGG
jgi:hypothetical protein